LTATMQRSGVEAVYKAQKTAAFIPFMLLCVVVLSTYIGVKVELVNRPPLKEMPAQQEPPPSPMQGKPLPDLKLTDLSGKSVQLSDYRGKVLFINIWATWCAPCRDEMPSMESLYQKLKGDGFEMIGISIDEGGLEVVKPFVKEFGLTFPILHNSTGDVQKKFMTTGVPETFLVNKNGIILHHMIGPTNWDRPIIVDALASLIAKGTSATP